MSTAAVLNPDEIVCSMTFKMTLKDWKQIRKTLSSNTAYTELQIMDEIQDLVYQLEKTVYNDNSDNDASYLNYLKWVKAGKPNE